MDAHRLLILTGASGVGKTTLARALANRQLDGVQVYEFDSVGVPNPDEMNARHGSPETWQRDTLDAWIRQLAANPDDCRVSVLDGQVRPSDARRALVAYGMDGRIVLVDCGADERSERLTRRGQPELATPEMDQWSAYLKGQADALELAVIDTTNQSIESATEALSALVQTMREEAAAEGNRSA